MKYRRLANTGIYVSELCLGAMTFGGYGPFQAIGALGQAEADALVHRALDAGVNFFDTANVYSAGQSEEMLGAALGPRRRDVVVATKVRGRMGDGPNEIGLSRVHIMQQCEASLRRLGTDYIDLYQIHGPDPVTDIRETLEALTDLVRTGKVRYIGCSNLPAWQLMKALGLSRQHGLAEFVSTQSYYSIAGRELEREMVPLVEDQGLAVLPWSPLAGGLLTGKFTRDGETDPEARRVSFDFPPVDRARGFDIIDVMREVSGAHGGLGGPGRPRLAPPPAGRHQRDHRGQAARSAERQPGLGGADPDPRRARAAGRGQRPPAGVSGVDGDSSDRPRAGHLARLEPVHPQVTGPEAPRDDPRPPQ